MTSKSDISKYGRLSNPYKDHIIIHPIMTGGILPKEVVEKLSSEKWMKAGYANCFDCLAGRSGLISKPPIGDFLADIAQFYGGDVAEHTFGSRAAQYTVMKTISEFAGSEGADEYAKTALVDPLCHYTTFMAAEANAIELVEAPHSGYPDYRVKSEDFAEKIGEIRAKYGKLPALIALTHAEPYYGNLNPVKEIGEIAEEYGIPYMVNCAYTAGVMPINMKEFKADFITVSAHKSMASLGPLGFLVTSFEWSKKAFKTSTIRTDWSGRSFGKKIPNIFGCSIGGIPLVSAMYSFPHVVERTKNWEKELEKTRWFIDEMEKMDGMMMIGERPHRHHLTHFETPAFWEISEHHRRKGFFLAEEMVSRGIVGLHRGLSKHVKLSVYGLSWDQVINVRNAFQEILDSHAKTSKSR